MTLGEGGEGVFRPPEKSRLSTLAPQRDFVGGPPETVGRHPVVKS